MFLSSVQDVSQVLNVFLNMFPISTTLSYILHSKFYSWNLDNHPKGEDNNISIFGTVQNLIKDAHHQKINK
jgi:dynactin complex subunit